MVDCWSLELYHLIIYCVLWGKNVLFIRSYNWLQVSKRRSLFSFVLSLLILSVIPSRTSLLIMALKFPASSNLFVSSTNSALWIASERSNFLWWARSNLMVHAIERLKVFAAIQKFLLPEEFQLQPKPKWHLFNLIKHWIFFGGHCQRILQYHFFQSLCLTFLKHFWLISINVGYHKQ